MGANPSSQNNSRKPLAPEAIAKLLEQATSQLDAKTVASLLKARNIALARQLSTNPRLTLITSHTRNHLSSHSLPRWGATTMLLAALFFGGVSYWQYRHEEDIAHLDIAILTDDLPLEVFVN